MKKRTIASLVILLLAVLGIWFWQTNSGKKDDSTGSQSLVIAVENEIGSLDPIKIVDSYNLRIGSQIFEGLLTLNADNEVEPRLAERWEMNDDATVWTFYIRPSVRFHNNPVFGETETRELNAEDVAYSLTRLLSKESPSSFALANIVEGAGAYRSGEAETVSGIRITEPMVVEVSLTQPDPQFIHRITSPWYAIIPKEAVELGADQFGITDLPATGPFRLVSHSENEVVVERYDDYWRDAPGNLKKATFRTIKNPQFRLNELRNQNVDISRLEADLASEVAQTVTGEDGSLELKPAYGDHMDAAVFPVLNSYFLGFNTETVPLSLREAIAAAVDRKQIAKAAAGPLGFANPSPLPNVLRPDQTSGSTGNNEPLSTPAGEIDRELELLVYNKENVDRVGALIQAQCANAGIEIKLTKLDFNAAVGKIIDGSAEAFVVNFDYAFSRPELILADFFTNKAIPMPNLFRYDSPKAMELISQLNLEKDPEKSLNIAAQLEQVIIDQVPAVFLYEKQAAVAWRSDLSGVRLTRNNLMPIEEIIVP